MSYTHLQGAKLRSGDKAPAAATTALLLNTKPPTPIEVPRIFLMFAIFLIFAGRQAEQR